MKQTFTSHSISCKLYQRNPGIFSSYYIEVDLLWTNTL